MQNHSVNSDLEQNRSLWREQKIVDYNFVASLIEGGLGDVAQPVLIKVRDGKVTFIEPAIKSDKRSQDKYSRFETVDKMFDTIQEELEISNVIVKYDKELGYPQKIDISFLDCLINGQFLRHFSLGNCISFCRQVCRS